MGWRGTLVLASLLLVAGAYAAYDIGSDPQATWEGFGFLGSTRPTPPGQQTETLIAFAPADIDTVRLRRGADDVTVRREAGGWTGIASGTAVDDFLASLATLSRIATLDVAAGDLADHGLAPPQTLIDLQHGGESPIEIRIGDRNPPATAVYVQVGTQDRVYLTGALILWELDKVLRAARVGEP